MTLASVLSVSRFGERVRLAVIEPITRLAIGADAAFHLADDRRSASASAGTVRVTRWFVDVVSERLTSPVALSMNSDVSVTTRPNDDADVTIRGLPAGSAMLQT